MNENEIYEVLNSFKEAIDYLVSQNEELTSRVNELQSTLMDEIVNPVRSELAAQEEESALSDFRCKYAEKLDKFDDFTRAIEGSDDFSTSKAVFDELKNVEKGDDFDEAAYVEEVAKNIEEQIEKIKKATGAESVTVESTEDGEVKVEVEDAENPSVEEAIAKEEEPSEEDKDFEIDDSVEESDPEALKKFEESLKK